MCRLFGLSAAPKRITATFWLVDAPDSLAVQSHREPDGIGLGTFQPDGSALVHKRPIAAFQDAEFGREARNVTSSTFLAHVRTDLRRIPSPSPTWTGRRLRDVTPVPPDRPRPPSADRRSPSSQQGDPA